MEYYEVVTMTGIGIIGFFLARFYYLVDEIRKDVKDILIEGGANKISVDNIKKDISEIKGDVHDIDKRVKHLEVINNVK